MATGARYTNRYISVLTITDRKVTHWLDYLDPVAVFDAPDGRHLEKRRDPSAPWGITIREPRTS